MIRQFRDNVGGAVLGGTADSVAIGDDDGCGVSRGVPLGVELIENVSGGVAAGEEVTEGVSAGVEFGVKLIENVSGGVAAGVELTGTLQVGESDAVAEAPSDCETITGVAGQ